MRALDEVGGTLQWRGRGFLSRTYDLFRADEESPDAEPFATLRWREAFLLGRSRGELTAAPGAWRFVPEGMLGRHVRLVTDAGAPVAAYGRTWRTGSLRFEDGRTLRWRRVHWLRRVWVFEDPNGSELVRFAIRFSLVNTRATVEIAAAVPSAERVLLAGFGFFLLRRAAAAARRAGS
jgi:hypothetical protein